MIALFTDFGSDGPYVGQTKAALLRHTASSTTPIVDLLHSAPAFRAQTNAHLLAALLGTFSPGDVILAVVDAGVGTSRQALVIRADGLWLVGPDNGLLSVVAARANSVEYWKITWRPHAISASFHGRDLFAPVAARLAAGEPPADWCAPIESIEVNFGAEDLARVIYIDRYGNAMTGLRAAGLGKHACMMVGTRQLPRRRVFSEAPTGGLFWYANSIGLAEIAANQASAAEMLGISVNDAVTLT